MNRPQFNHHPTPVKRRPIVATLPTGMTVDFAQSAARGTIVGMQPQCDACTDGIVWTDAGAQWCSCRAASKVATLLTKAGVPFDLAPAFNGQHPDAIAGRMPSLKVARAMLNGNASGLVMVGDAGVGKSHIAAWLVSEYVSRGHGAVWASVDAIGDRVRSGFDAKRGVPQSLDRYVKAALLVVDDVRPGDAYGMRMMSRAIRLRFERGATTVMTSNGSASELASAFEPHVWSRVQSVAAVLEVRGRNRRGVM